MDNKDHCKEMGGCCCCSSKGTELNGTPAYYYCPRAPEEQELLSSHHGAASTLSTGLLVDTNLGTSPSNTYRPPPTPIPYDVDLGHPQTLPVAEESCVNKNVTAELVASSIYVGQFARLLEQGNVFTIQSLIDDKYSCYALAMGRNGYS